MTPTNLPTPAEARAAQPGAELDAVIAAAKKIVELAEKATDAPWEAESRHCENPDNDPEFGTQSGLGWELTGPPEPMRGQFENGYDALLCAAARNDAPAVARALLAATEENERLRLTIEEAITILEGLGMRHGLAENLRIALADPSPATGDKQ